MKDTEVTVVAIFDRSIGRNGKTKYTLVRHSLADDLDFLICNKRFKQYVKLPSKTLQKSFGSIEKALLKRADETKMVRHITVGGLFEHLKKLIEETPSCYDEPVLTVYYDKEEECHYTSPIDEVEYCYDGLNLLLMVDKEYF